MQMKILKKLISLSKQYRVPTGVVVLSSLSILWDQKHFSGNIFLSKISMTYLICLSRVGWGWGWGVRHVYLGKMKHYLSALGKAHVSVISNQCPQYILLSISLIVQQ